MPKPAKATQQRIHSVTTDTTFPDGRQTCARCGLTITDAGKAGFAPQAILEETIDGQTRFRIFTADDASKDAVPCDEKSELLNDGGVRLRAGPAPA